MYRYILFFSRLSNLTDNTVSFLFFFSSFIISLPVPPFLSFLLFLLFFFHFSHYFSACSSIPFLPSIPSFILSFLPLLLCLFLLSFSSVHLHIPLTHQVLGREASISEADQEEGPATAPRRHQAHLSPQAR